jgi:PAS domain S-box-containing protein
MPLMGSASTRPEEAVVQARILKALQEVALAAGGILDPNELARVAIDHACDLVGGWSATLAWFEPDGTAQVLADNHPTVFPSIDLEPGRGMTGQVLLTGELIVVSDYAGWEHAFDWAIEGGVRSMIGVPLKVRDRPVGALLVRSSEADFFQPELCEALTLLASVVAPAIQAASLSVDREKQAGLFRALHDLAVAASGVLEPRELARIAVERCRELLHVDGTVLFHFDRQSGYLEPLHESTSEVVDRQVKPGEGAVGLAFYHRQPYAVDDYAAWEHRLLGPSDRGLAAGLSYPLVAGDRAIGVVGVWSRMPRAWSENEIQILSLVAAQIGPALQRATAAVEIEVQAETFRALNEVAVAAAGVLEPAELARIATERACALAKSSGASLTWYDEKGQGLRLLAETEIEFDPGKIIPIADAGAHGLVFDIGKPVAVTDYPSWSRRVASEVGRVTSALVVPLQVRQRRIGTLGVSYREHHHFGAEDIQMLTLLAAEVAPSLEAARLHEDLRESEGRKSAIVESSLNCIMAADDCGRIIEYNLAAERIFGFPREDVLGKGLWDTIIPARLRRAHQRGLDAIGMGEGNEPGRRFETICIRADGSEFPVEVSVAAFKQDGRAMLSTSIRDLSERVEAETMRQESEAKSRFVAAMSHELRTPLNSILGFSQLLSSSGSGELNDRQQRYVGHIESSGRHLLSLINDVLDLSKVEAGQMEVELEPIELEPLLEETINQVRPLADANGLELVLDPGPGIWIRADGRRFLQVMLNLLSNAIKFTPAGGSVRVAAVRAGRTARISVIDTGIGIPPEEQQRIFEEFTQVDRQAARSTEGTGLGLALSRRLLQLMRGNIEVESEEGRGSTFSVVLPRIRPGEVADARPTLLVIQGAVDDAELVSKLASGPYRVFSTGTVREAAQIARRRRLAGVVIGESVLPADEDWLRSNLGDHPRTHTLPILSAAVALHPGVLIRD